MKRHALREQVFKLLFRAEFNTPEEMREQADFFFESGDITATDKDKEYITGKCIAIVEKIPEIDDKLEEKLVDWKLSRIGKVELTILRLAIYEIMYDESVPEGAAVNEAVELAKRFGQDNAGAFINAVLSKFTTAKNGTQKDKSEEAKETAEEAAAPAAEEAKSEEETAESEEEAAE